MDGRNVFSYSKNKFGKKNLSAHFKVNEFACSDGSDTIFISRDLIGILEQVRTHFNVPVTVVSGYRTDTYNKKIGGAEYSQHKYGTAADIRVANNSPTRVAEYVNSIMPNTGGIGIYSTFTHIDVRMNKSRWKG